MINVKRQCYDKLVSIENKHAYVNVLSLYSNYGYRMSWECHSGLCDETAAANNSSTLWAYKIAFRGSLKDKKIVAQSY